MEDNHSTFIAKMILIIFACALALFWIVTGIIDVVGMNSSNNQIREVKPDEFKEGMYFNTYINDNFCCYAEVKSNIGKFGNESYYLVPLFDNDHYISINAKGKLNDKISKLPLISKHKEKFERSLPLKGKVRKLDDAVYKELRNVWAKFLETTDEKEIDKYAIPYYIDTSAYKTAICRIIEGGILIILCSMIFLYKKLASTYEATNIKAKLVLYISALLLLGFIVLLFMNVTTMFSI